jgi:hypothetical protein
MDFPPHHLSLIVVFWLAIVALVFFGSFFRYLERTSRHRMIERLAEKGQPIPPEFMSSPRDEVRRHLHYRYRHPIQSGIQLMCVGIALSVFMWAMTGGGNLFPAEHGVPNWLVFVGIFPFMLGLARVLGGLFDRPDSK